MKRVLFYVSVLFVAPLAMAKLTSAKWGTEPAAPVYAGQPYELTLTFETQLDEEISNVQLDQSPGREADYQTTKQSKGKRLTTLHWKQLHPRPKMCAIPASRLVANVTHAQTFGFMRTMNTTRQSITVPAFNYEIVPLPDAAKGAHLGTFKMTLTADETTFSPGEVRLLTATLTAEEGCVPQDFAFTLAESEAISVYPFQWVRRTERECVAQAHIVITAEAATEVRLNAFQSFDLATRALKTVTCPPLTLTLRTETMDEAEADIFVGVGASTTANQVKSLRFAPSIAAPVIGTLEGVWTEKERYEAWVRVETAQLSGWIREEELKDLTP